MSGKGKLQIKQSLLKLIGSMILIAGFIKESGLISFLDDRLAPKRRHHNISHGEAIALLMLALSNGRYTAVYDLIDTLDDVPVDVLLNRQGLQSNHAQKDVVLSALSAMYDYGCEKLFQEFANHAHSLFVLGSTVAVHLDSTSITLHHVIDGDEKELLSIGLDKLPQEQQAELLKICNEGVKDGKHVKLQLEINKGATKPSQSLKASLQVKRGYSKSHRPDLGQIVLVGIVDGNGIPLRFSVVDGNSSDKTLFAEISASVLPALVSQYEELKYLVCDSAGCTKNCFDAVLKSGLNIITRVPDSRSIFRQTVATLKVEDMSLVDKDDPNGLRCFAVNTVLYEGTEVSGFVYYNPALKSTKSPSVVKRALKEQKDACKALNRKYKCTSDADDNFERIKQKAKLIDIKPETDPNTGKYLYEAKEVKDGRGRRSKDPSKNKTRLTDARVKCDVEIDKDALDHCIDRECMYLIVTTCVEAKLSAAELSRLYKNNIQVERLWKMIKDSRFAHKAVGIKGRERLEAFMTVIGLYMIACTCIQVKIRTLVSSGQVMIPKASGAKDRVSFHKNPTIKAVMKFVDRLRITNESDRDKSHKLKVEYECVSGLFNSLGGTWANLWNRLIS